MGADMNIKEFLKLNDQKELLRISTVGSIDDGKSTLIGRLLHDSKGVFEDQLESVKNASKKINEGVEIDFALITDGLKSEREQGITIDVAYRYFSTPKRKFIIADTPGHEQYTRNMATGASTADVAIVLIDARNGVLRQTKRHTFISSLLGVPHLFVAVNKMDMVGYDKAVFEDIKDDFSNFAQRLNINDIRFIPISALKGDNVVARSEKMPWYKGESFLEMLESLYIASDKNLIDLRFPVQYVSRPHQDFRGYCGQVSSGIVRIGDEVMILPSMKTSRVKSITTMDGELEYAFPPMSVTVTLEDEIDISRGDMLVHSNNQPHVERNFEAMVVWMGDEPMNTNKSYYIKHTTQMMKTRIDEVRYRVNINDLRKDTVDNLSLNEIGRVVFSSTKPVFYDPYIKNRLTGSFIIIDSISNVTVGSGMIIDRNTTGKITSKSHEAAKENKDLIHRSSNIKLQERIEYYRQKPHTIWITGLNSSGKTKVAYTLERKLFDLGASCVVLDGENVRLGLNRELDFTAEDRAEHVRRVAEVARVLNEAGIITICAFVSPTATSRESAKAIVGEERFIEVHMDTPLEWCEANDTTGLYKKARDGEIDNFAGITTPYERPENANVTLRSDKSNVDEMVDELVTYLRRRGIFSL